jgi:hypothetical protein
MHIYAIGILFNCKYTLKTVAIWLDLCLCFIVGYGAWKPETVKCRRFHLETTGNTLFDSLVLSNVNWQTWCHYLFINMGKRIMTVWVSFSFILTPV